AIPSAGRARRGSNVQQRHGLLGFPQDLRRPSAREVRARSDGSLEGLSGAGPLAAAHRPSGRGPDAGPPVSNLEAVPRRGDAEPAPDARGGLLSHRRGVAGPRRTAGFPGGGPLRRLGLSSTPGTPDEPLPAGGGGPDGGRRPLPGAAPP